MTLLLSIYGPLLGAALVWSWGAVPGRAALLLILAGLLLWTFLEYLLHRFAFHGFAPHHRHHEAPREVRYILAPLWFSLTATAVIYGVLGLVSGAWRESALAGVGMIAGYLAYEAVHLRIHSRAAGGRALRFLRKHHYYHHFASDRVHYGVTSPLWDHLFRTLSVRRLD